MKVYKVKVNDKVYEVEVEAVDEVKGSIETPAAPKANTSTATDGSNTINAPIAGKVLDIKVSVGNHVSKGQTVAIIEAMKLENEIQSAFDGKVVDIRVSAGNDVKNKDVLIVLE